jgi:hypothetical protein
MELVPLLPARAYKRYCGNGRASYCYLRRIASAAEHWLAVLRLSVQRRDDPKYPPALIEYATVHMPKKDGVYDNGKAIKWIGVQRAHMLKREPKFLAASPLIGPLSELKIMDNAAVADENGQLVWMNGLPLDFAHAPQEPGSHWHVERYGGSDHLFLNALEQGSCIDPVCLIKHF